MTATFKIVVSRVVREDVVAEVEAPDLDRARAESELQATSIPQDSWDIYDCDYSSEKETER